MAQTVSLVVDGSPMRLFVDGAAGRPGVVVMVHGPGLDRFIEAKVTALADHGFVAAAPDVFHRQPDDGTDTMTRVGRLRDREIVDDALAAAGHLRTLTEAPLAVIGFCMGGRNTYLLAGACPTMWQAAAVFYGGNIMKAWGDPISPFDRTDQIACPVLGIFGTDDTNPSPEDVARIDAELARSGKVHAFHSYAGAGHAFLNFTNPERYREPQASDAWRELLAFLDARLA